MKFRSQGWDRRTLFVGLMEGDFFFTMKPMNAADYPILCGAFGKGIQPERIQGMGPFDGRNGKYVRDKRFDGNRWVTDGSRQFWVVLPKKMYRLCPLCDTLNIVPQGWCAECGGGLPKKILMKQPVLGFDGVETVESGNDKILALQEHLEKGLDGSEKALRSLGVYLLDEKQKQFHPYEGYFWSVTTVGYDL